MTTVVKRRLIDFDVQNLANVAWASATVKNLDEKLFAELAGRAAQWSVAFDSQAVQMILWAVLQGECAVVSCSLFFRAYQGICCCAPCCRTLLIDSEKQHHR
eukprot:gnl/TRDRNA2_/TRDRNA2_137933_c0_seq1.p2 gnl/TRDRNA2_/TRDRNA2_137933_c0~~gnl/TRDRNA2_/TRDRNA2_137933_c0_seq1.p2  ORF type:complete len:102 (-),score=16.78 gnl/TRDRNA2_/TRDRNA2_137933_c0_seq1:50-355(-)